MRNRSWSWGPAVLAGCALCAPAFCEWKPLGPFDSPVGRIAVLTDPQGVAWETYHTLGEAEVYGASTKKALDAQACCTPKPAAGVPEKPTARTCC